MKVQGCIFDLDGTLLDTVESIARCANQALEAYGFSGHATEKYNYFAGDGQVELLRRALKASGDEQGTYLDRVIETYTKLFQEGCMYHVKPYDGIVDLLQNLQQKGMKLAVLSNKDDQNVKDMIARFFPKGMFQYVAGRRKGIPKKPDPSGVALILKEWKIQPEQCIYMGDTNTDMQTGRNAHAITIGVTWGFRLREELQQCHPYAIIDQPQELLRLIDSSCVREKEKRKGMGQ